MTAGVPRRTALKQLGAAGAGAVLAGRWTGAQDRPLVVAGRPVEIAVASVSEVTARLTIVSLPAEGTAPVPDDGSVVASAPVAAQRRALAAPERVRAGRLAVRLSPDPLSIAIETADGHPVQTLTFDTVTGAMAFDVGHAPLLGLGEGGPQFDRRGSNDRMRSGQGGYQLRTHGGRVPIQWLVGAGGGWAMFVHHPQGRFDLTGERGVFSRLDTAPDLPLDVFIVSSSDPTVVMAEYARLTGFPEMPPLWSFGYQQSHRTLAGPDEVRWVARTLREKRLPCDTLIYLGTGFTPSGWNTNNGEFTWNEKNFPDPRAMIEELHDLHFKVVVHVVLEGRRLTGRVSDPCPDPPAFTGAGREWPDDQQVGCYWPIHRSVWEDGIDGWWPDQGDGLDAPSRLARIRMYWEGTQQFAPGERVYALHRNGHAGMARYAAFLWSGDVYTTWETLRTHVPVAVNTGLSGIPFWGTDIGGFVPTKEYTGELHVRWFQFGAFCPLFRAHGRDWHLRLPWGWNTGELGPDEISNYTGGAASPDPSELHDPDVEPICRQYLELRSRLTPYLYTAVREAHETGLPVMRALWIHHPDDPVATARGDQYFWGRDILVAPVVEQGATERRLYLPRGVWHDFWTDERVDGGREVNRPVDLATTPLYVRAGAVIPFGPVKQYTSEPVDAPIALVVYPGADGVSWLYEDDGHSLGYQGDDWMKVEMAWNDEARRLTLRLAGGSRLRPPEKRTFQVRVAGSSDVRTVTFEGKSIDVTLRTG